jgi:hypothetical protein
MIIESKSILQNEKYNLTRINKVQKSICSTLDT